MTTRPHVQTCVIPAGLYTIGDDALAISRPAHQIDFAGGHISVTAITNGDFHHFIAADGYTTERYWTQIGWRWQKNRQESQPAFWDESRFNHALQPVVGVTWYEAVAFANWLQELTGQPWQLPSEAAWEIATRPNPTDQQTTDQPNRPAPKQMNTAEQGIGRPWAAIGRGQVSWCGGRDLLGNIWEWTASRWGRNWQSLDYPYPYQPDDGREDLSGSHARVMRGGSWFDPLKAANASNRGRYLPGSRGSNIGFRLFHPQ